MQVNVGDLPVWHGVQDKPGFRRLPFALGVSRGLICVVSSPLELDRITEEYSKDSYTFITSPPGTSAWGNRLGDWYFDMLAKQVGRLHSMSVLEIGSGTLYIAERVVNELNTAHFIACDPALGLEAGAEGVEVVREYFTSKTFGNQAFDLILSINNLEHIPDPFEYLVHVRRLLEGRKGLLYLVVPDCSRGFQTGDIGICVHEHVSYFTPASLASVLGNCGFAIQWIHSQDDTIFAKAQPASGRSWTDSADSSVALLKNFETRVNRNLKIAEKLIFTHKQNAKLAIHGCSVGLNNVFGLLGIESEANIFLFDGDSNKVGKYLPIFDRPIMAATDNCYKTMQTAIVAALTFYEEISRFILRDHGIPVNRIYPLMPLE